MARTPTGTITSVATAFSAAKPSAASQRRRSRGQRHCARPVQRRHRRNHLRLGRLNKLPRVGASPPTPLFLKSQHHQHRLLSRRRRGRLGAQGHHLGAGRLHLNHSTSGGDPKEVNVSSSESDQEFTINDGFTAIKRTMSMDADMIDTPFYNALRDLTEVQSDTIIQRRAPPAPSA